MSAPWTTIDEPARMLSQLIEQKALNLTPRRLRLAMAAIYRLQIADAIKQGVGASDIAAMNLRHDRTLAMADGQTPMPGQRAMIAFTMPDHWICLADPMAGMRQAVGLLRYRPNICAILREVFFDAASISFDRAWQTPDVLGMCRALAGGDCQYDQTAMMALHDALEDAGCLDTTILNHCLGSEPCPTTRDVDVVALGACGACGDVGNQAWHRHLSGEYIRVCNECGHQQPMQKKLTNKCQHCGGTGWRPKVPCFRGCWLTEYILQVGSLNLQMS